MIHCRRTGVNGQALEKAFEIAFRITCPVTYIKKHLNRGETFQSQKADQGGLQQRLQAQISIRGMRSWVDYCQDIEAIRKFESLRKVLAKEHRNPSFLKNRLPNRIVSWNLNSASKSEFRLEVIQHQSCQIIESASIIKDKIGRVEDDHGVVISTVDKLYNILYLLSSI